MTTPQMLAFGILGGTMILFIWGRLRYDLIAILAILASLAAGTVSANKAFSGFSDDIVIIVASALVVSGAIARSGIIESGVRLISSHVQKVHWQLAVLVIFLHFGYRLLPRDREATPPMGEALDIKDYNTEAKVGAGSNAIGKTVAEFTADDDEEIEITGVLRGDARSKVPLENATLKPRDTLLLMGDPEQLERAIVTGGLDLAGQDPSAVTETRNEDIGVIEAVITANFPLVRRAAGSIALHERHGVNLLAIRAAYEHVEWPILFMLGALIPVSGALQEIGGTQLIRFGDYARLGAPLSHIVILIGVPMILFFWPVRLGNSIGKIIKYNVHTRP